ncbi:MAG TPA: M20/M25/M40 family metallo-hydrolase [Acidimicrobiales bacterium]|nr:M20/M25/M40 family metallo-hydrolase [Acidimicrobiales bacterium]
MSATPIPPAAGGTHPLRAEAQRRWEDDVLPALFRYATIPCLSPDFDEDWEAAGHLAEAASMLRSWAEERAVEGLGADIVGGAGRTPLLLVDAPPTAGTEGTVLVYGHLDKQPPLGMWREGLAPFAPVREGDRIYGRGTADDGYALFAALTAVELLDAAGIPRPRVVVLVEASEESGSPDLPAHLADVAGRLGTPELVVCLDSGCLSYDRLWLTSSLRGNLVGTVSVQVLTEGVHSGSAGGIVPTSFRLLRLLLDRLEDPRTGEVRLESLRAGMPGSAEGGLLPAWSGEEVFPVVPGLELEGTSEPDRLGRRAWAPALAVTGMDGIPSVRDGGNVLRPFTTAKFSLRLPPTVDAAKAMEAVESVLLADPPSRAEVRVHFDTPATGWAAPPLEDWVDAAFQRASEELFGMPAGSLGEGGTIPFLAMLGERYPGVPLVATGVLGPGSNAHGPNEFLHLPMAEAVTVATARLLEAAARRPLADAQR